MSGAEMRCTLALLIALALAVPGASQGTGAKKTDPKKAEPAPESSKVGGKTIDQWMKEFSIKDSSRRETAVRAVLAFPPDAAVRAIPGLLAELRRHSASQPTDLSVRCAICVVLAELFGNYSDKIDPKTQQVVAVAARPFLRDSQVVMRFRAAQLLGAIGPEAHAAIPDLLSLLKDQSSWEMRQSAAQALGQIAHDKKSGPNPNVLQSLYLTLADPAFSVRLAAIQALTYLGPPGDPSASAVFLKALENVALKDSEPSVQIWARVAVAVARQDFSLEILGPIGTMMAEGDTATRTQALQSMGAVGPNAKKVIPSMIKSLGDPDPIVKMTAIWALGRMGTAALNALGPLAAIAADPKSNEATKKAAKDSIEKINGK